jgi:predicted membrane-bound spermidine synthase
LTRTVSTVVGCALGLVLSLSAFAAAGFGHGSYVILGVVSAPFCFGGALVALVTTPLLWALASYLAASAECSSRRALLFLLPLHYLGALIAVTVWPYADWSYVSRSVGASMVGSLTYATMQVYVWHLFRRAGRVSRA